MPAHSPAFSRIAVMPMEVKELNEADRTFWAFASTPETDRAKERVTTDAMRRALDGYMVNPVITWQHDTDRPVGTALDGKVSKQGTQLLVFISDKTEAARDAWGLVQDRVIRSMSIGFNPYSRGNKVAKDDPADFEQTGDELAWTNIEWLETGLVTIPCNRGAIIPFAKGLGIETDWPALPEDMTSEHLEERRFRGDLESATNIITHWHKEGRILCAETAAELRTVRDRLGTLLEAYPVAPEPAPQGGLSLPAVAALSLPMPTIEGVTLPGQ